MRPPGSAVSTSPTCAPQPAPRSKKRTSPPRAWSAWTWANCSRMKARSAGTLPSVPKRIPRACSDSSTRVAAPRFACCDDLRGVGALDTERNWADGTYMLCEEAVEQPAATVRPVRNASLESDVFMDYSVARCNLRAYIRVCSTGWPSQNHIAARICFFASSSGMSTSTAAPGRGTKTKRTASEYAKKLMAKMRMLTDAKGQPIVVDVQSSREENSPEFDVTVDRENARLLNVSEQDVAQTIIIGLLGNTQITPVPYTDPKNGNEY